MRKIIQTLRRAKRVFISTHVNPDPDAIGSELAVAAYLKSLGKTVVILNEEPVAARFLFLPGSRSIKAVSKTRRVTYDAAVVVDCGDLDRIGSVKDALDPARPLINIDHHITNTRFGTLNLVKPKASSTAEVLFGLFQAARCKMTRTIAINLYAGIMTDTGSFRYDNTSPYTHEVTAALMKHGVSASGIYRKVYERVSFRDVKNFMSVVNTFKTLHGGRVAVIELLSKTVRKFSKDFDLRDTIFKYLRSVQNIEVIIIFTQVSRDETRVNFRSSGSFDVAGLANAFGGGGHRNASGCRMEGPISKVRPKILREMRKRL